MDILISSNLERLLFHLTDENDAKLREWMGALSSEGKYTVDSDVAEKVSALFDAGCCDDEETRETIAKTFKDGYLCDTHTAVAVKVYEEYVKATGDKTETVIASTANPYKFSDAVLKAVDTVPADADEFEQVELLVKATGEPCPPQLANLSDKEVRFTSVCDKEDMTKMVYGMLGIN